MLHWQVVDEESTNNKRSSVMARWGGFEAQVLCVECGCTMRTQVQAGGMSLGTVGISDKKGLELARKVDTYTFLRAAMQMGGFTAVE